MDKGKRRKGEKEDTDKQDNRQWGFRKFTGGRGDMETPLFYILNHARFEKQHVSGSPIAGIKFNRTQIYADNRR